jgi:hypothetical protein
VDTNVLEELAALIFGAERQVGILSRKMEAARSSEKLIITYGIILCHNSQDHHLNIHCHENLKA